MKWASWNEAIYSTQRVSFSSLVTERISIFFHSQALCLLHTESKTIETRLKEKKKKIKKNTGIENAQKSLNENCVEWWWWRMYVCSGILLIIIARCLQWLWWCDLLFFFYFFFTFVENLFRFFLFCIFQVLCCRAHLYAVRNTRFYKEVLSQFS